MASYGKIIRPYHLKDSEWVENQNFQPNKDEKYLLSNENLMAGSSGSPTLLSDFKTEKIKDIHGKEWILAEVNSIHFGGEFIPCSGCLSINPKLRSLISTNDLFNLPGCEICKGNPHNNHRPMVIYNYGVSFNHPAIVDYYWTEMRSKFNICGILSKSSLKDYFALHNKFISSCAACAKDNANQICSRCKSVKYCRMSGETLA